MSRCASDHVASVLLGSAALGLMITLLITFGVLNHQFLSFDNLSAILVQSSWLAVMALGMNFVLLTAGVDLSVGSIMYLAALTVSLGLGAAPVWVCVLASLLVGTLCGAVNGSLIVLGRLPAFIVTLSTIFIGRGFGLYLTSTRIVYAGPAVASFGRARAGGVAAPLWLAGAAAFCAWIVFKQTPLGPYVRSIGADGEGARRAGVPVAAVTFGVYVLCGAAAGLGGFISLSQTSAASGAFGQGAEFLSIAAAVLGGTSLFGGRGTLWAPLIGAILITMVQNGLAMINANPYAYPVITGTVIFVAALIDSLRSGAIARLGKRRITANYGAE
jgi:ribose transport system permease protein